MRFTMSGIVMPEVRPSVMLVESHRVSCSSAGLLTQAQHGLENLCRHLRFVVYRLSSRTFSSSCRGASAGPNRRLVEEIIKAAGGASRPAARTLLISHGAPCSKRAASAAVEAGLFCRIMHLANETHVWIVPGRRWGPDVRKPQRHADEIWRSFLDFLGASNCGGPSPPS